MQISKTVKLTKQKHKDLGEILLLEVGSKQGSLFDSWHFDGIDLESVCVRISKATALKLAKQLQTFAGKKG